MTVKLKNEIILDDFNLHSKCPFRSNGHFQVNFYPILMAIIAFCAKSVNNPKTPLIPRPIMHERKKDFCEQKAGKMYQLMILLFFWFVVHTMLKVQYSS